MDFVVDSSILIDKFRGGEGWFSLENAVDELNPRLYLPSIVQFELMSGQSTKNIKKLKEIRGFVDRFRKIDLTEDIARRAGFLFRDLGIKLGVVDYIVAATALELGAQVVTLNKKHFEKVPGVEIYEF